MKGPLRTVSEDALEREWIEIQAAQQDRRLFKPLYDRYYEPVFRFIFQRTADTARAADICAHVFLRAMEKLDQYRYQGVPFSAWLFRIASNEVGQHFRTTQRNRVVCADDFQLSDLIAEVDDKHREELLELLPGALQTLAPRDMDLIEMRFFEERSFKEIADILEITEPNAKMRTYRILEKLKKHLLSLWRP